MTSPSIAEVRELKQKLEADMKVLLEKFSEETGLLVFDIDPCELTEIGSDNYIYYPTIRIRFK